MPGSLYPGAMAERRKLPNLVKIAEVVDKLPCVRLFGKLICDEPDEDTLAREFLEQLGITKDE